MKGLINCMLKKGLESRKEKKFFNNLYEKWKKMTFDEKYEFVLFMFLLLGTLCAFFSFLFSRERDHLETFALLFIFTVSYFSLYKKGILDFEFRTKNFIVFILIQILLIFLVIVVSYPPILKLSRLEHSMFLFISLLFSLGLMFMFSFMIGVTIYLIISYPPLFHCLSLKLIKNIVKIHCILKKEKFSDESVSIHPSRVLYDNKLYNYLYFFYYLSIICIPVTITFMEVSKISYLQEITKINFEIQIKYLFGGLVKYLFWFLIIISPLFFSLHLSHFKFFSNKEIGPFIFNKLFIPGFFVSTMRIILNPSYRDLFFLIIFPLIFFISGVAFGFSFVFRYSIKKINESPKFKKLIQYSH